MLTKFMGKKITGILGILPENEYDYDEETKEFADRQTKRLKRIMGYGKRRAVKPETATSDLCIYGLNYILDNNWINREEIGGIVVVTLTPDYFVPHVSNIIQGECNLPKDVVCMDIAQGCSAYLMGLMQAFMLLEHMEDKKVLVFTGDVLNRKAKTDKERQAQFGGDAASVTVVENDEQAKDIYFNMYSDGKDRDCLIMPAGGYRLPRSAETAEFKDYLGDGVLRCKNHIWMEGSKVFNFVQKEVPPMIEEILQYAGISKNDVDWFLFHQPNKFMMEKLADKMQVSYEKMPMNIVGEFGNSSGSTIPIDITYNVAKDLLENERVCCLSGFGSGLTWSSALVHLGKLRFCELVTSTC